MHLLEILFFAIGAMFMLGSLDDLIIDAAFALNGVRPRTLTKLRWQHWRTTKEKPLAIMIPAWKESSVLEAMIKTNLSRIKYRNYRWFIGVYPNDQETVDVAMKLQARYPDMVTVVVTDRPGPTSKAHCVNCIMQKIEEMVTIARREGQGWIPHYVALHDAEDVIHPDAFTVVNGQPSNLDFIQMPIFSLPVPASQWVSGTYLDEFAEIHLKDMPVRQLLGMPIPSAGVGTFFGWNMMEMLGKRFGTWLDEGTLTEDYEIAFRIARLGGKQRFVLVRDENNQIVATREYFPEELGRSIRQKTRWTIGMGLQMVTKWGLYGTHRKWNLKNLVTAYTVWRDRKAIWASPMVFIAWGVALVTLLVRASRFHDAAQFQHMEAVRIMFVANASLFTFRMYQRARFCGQLYGPVHGLLAVPRAAVGAVINGTACVKAWKQFLFAAKTQAETKMTWDKTDHKFPDLATLDGERKAI